jgi:endonuclease-3
MEIVKALNVIEGMFPDAHCELDYATAYQLAISVILSAQATDVSVNQVTPGLFAKYPDARSMALATQEEIASLIHRIGLFRNKAKNICAFASELVMRYDGEVPARMEQLVALPGIGRKSANVILAVGFAIPALAVDTHVLRVSRRLGWVECDADVDETEIVLKKMIPEDRWIKAHHSILFFGRYHCKSLRPLCNICPLSKDCVYHIEKSRNQA